MNKIILLYVILILISNSELILSTNKSDLIAVALATKNDENTICKTLDPFVQAGYNSFLVFDTFSKDKTVEIAKQYFLDSKVDNGLVIQEEFPSSYAKMKNRMLELVRQKLPNSKFVLIFEFDCEIKNADKLIDFCKLNENSSTNVYTIFIKGHKYDVGYKQSLIRIDSKEKFIQPVFEYIDTKSQERVDKEIYFLNLESDKIYEAICKAFGLTTEGKIIN